MLIQNANTKLIEKLKAATLTGNVWGDVGPIEAPFNLNGELKYSDLSHDIRARITKEEFESINNFFDAEKVFNKAYKEVDPFPKRGFRISQPILVGTIYFQGKRYYVNERIAIGYEYYFKPVIIEWYMKIEPYDY